MRMYVPDVVSCRPSQTFPTLESDNLRQRRLMRLYWKYKQIFVTMNACELDRSQLQYEHRVGDAGVDQRVKCA